MDAKLFKLPYACLETVEVPLCYFRQLYITSIHAFTHRLIWQMNQLIQICSSISPVDRGCEVLIQRIKEIPPWEM